MHACFMFVSHAAFLFALHCKNYLPCTTTINAATLAIIILFIYLFIETYSIEAEGLRSCILKNKSNYLYRYAYGVCMSKLQVIVLSH